jgi:K+-sensing histidine kinase KdpD
LKGSVTVTVTHYENKDLLVTSVKDTGIGIKSEEIPKLFKLFGKLENYKLNPQGVGFGLSICKQLSESLGGYIGVESVYNQGSTFQFAIKANTSTHPSKFRKIETTTKVDASDVPRIEDEPVKKAKTVNLNSSLVGLFCMG